MDPERWQKIDNLLQSVLRQSPSQREAFLRQACEGDEALEREVRSLLTAAREAGSFLESPALEMAARDLADLQGQDFSESIGSLIGHTISHYRILEKLGSGGMGVVWKARDTHLDRFVALKVLPGDKLSDPERNRRFVQEAKAASALNHPNIVHIYDIADAEGMQYIAMEYVAGKTLGQLMGRKGLRLNDTLKYAVQISSALAKAHGAGIVHRDLKPANIMVNTDGVVKLLDFGLAQ